MNLDESASIIQNYCNENVEGLVIIALMKDQTFTGEVIGESTYLESIGALESFKHDLINIAGNEGDTVFGEKK